MFLYRINDFEELYYILANLAGYLINMRPIDINQVIYLKIEPHPDRVGDFRLAEMFCQMNHHQISGVCAVCKEAGEAYCGHLTFGSAI